MEENFKKRQDEVYSKRIRAGKKRTYFFDVKPTKNNDYYLTITESKKDFRNQDNYIKHKIFIYKEDFNKFLTALGETIDYVKKELLPDFPFDQYNKEQGEELKDDFNIELDDDFNHSDED
ncbi:MAG: PUR family DNA/RNA-binding protein [Sphingobacteriales bacterium]|nr:PUR family DNA/RNA-binding protein [Sphingobacteriales bacterium]